MRVEEAIDVDEEESARFFTPLAAFLRSRPYVCISIIAKYQQAEAVCLYSLQEATSDSCCMERETTSGKKADGISLSLSPIEQRRKR